MYHSIRVDKTQAFPMEVKGKWARLSVDLIHSIGSHIAKINFK